MKSSYLTKTFLKVSFLHKPHFVACLGMPTETWRSFFQLALQERHSSRLNSWTDTNCFIITILFLQSFQPKISSQQRGFLLAF